MLRLLAVCLLLAGLAACAAGPSERSAPVLVGGATGQQGGAVVNELLARGYRVRALTRRPDSAAAAALAARGVEIVQGDYNDAYSLDRALVGVRQMFFYGGRSATELQEGLNVIAAAQRARLEHLVYSSGAAAEPGKGLGGPKTQVELALVASGVPYTVLRPVAFMDNFAGQQQRIAKRGITDSRAPERLLHFIAVQDIGLLVGAAFDNPQRWIGQAINIAGDRLKVAEHVAVFSRVMQQPIAYHRLSPADLQASLPKPLRPLFAWYETVGYTADVPALRAEFPQLLTLEDYLRATGWEPNEP